MPYISTEEVKARREALKKEFSDFKFSVVRRHYSTIVVTILSSPLAIEDKDQQVNEFHIEDNFKHTPELRDALLKIKEIADKGNCTISEDGDYGSIPKFYIDIRIGGYDRPYQQIVKK